jgi:hypothetical protein
MQGTSSVSEESVTHKSEWEDAKERKRAYLRAYKGQNIVLALLSRRLHLLVDGKKLSGLLGYRARWRTRCFPSLWRW